MRTETKSIERRAKIRFPMLREMRYKILEDDRIVASGAGTTCNMSSGGVAFVPDRPLALGTFIELAISWPVALDNGCPMRLVVFGKVVRAGNQRTACTVERHEFRTQGRTLQFAAPPARTDSRLLRWADGLRKEETKAQAQRASA
jgi:hypothetical protein